MILESVVPRLGGSDAQRLILSKSILYYSILTEISERVFKCGLNNHVQMKLKNETVFRMVTSSRGSFRNII